MFNKLNKTLWDTSELIRFDCLQTKQYETQITTITKELKETRSRAQAFRKLRRLHSKMEKSHFRFLEQANKFHKKMEEIPPESPEYDSTSQINTALRNHTLIKKELRQVINEHITSIEKPEGTETESNIRFLIGTFVILATSITASFLQTIFPIYLWIAYGIHLLPT